VYSATDPVLRRAVAIKVLHDESAPDTARIRREARALARLAHPNVVPVYDVGEHEGNTYVVMEWIRGETLRTWMARPKPWQETVALFVKAGEGLAAAHRMGLVHRDFKPANVLIDPTGAPRVVDFGLVRHIGSTEAGAQATVWISQDTQTTTRNGRLSGTPAYMAPEQLEGRPVDARADQFAFCVALFEALASRRPFEGKAIGDLILSTMETDHRTLGNGTSVPRKVLQVLRRGLATDVDERYPSMRELLDALERCLRRVRTPWIWTAITVAGLACAMTISSLSGHAVVAPTVTERPEQDQAKTKAEDLLTLARAQYDDGQRRRANSSARESFWFADLAGNSSTKSRAAAWVLLSCSDDELNREGDRWLGVARTELLRAGSPPDDAALLQLAAGTLRMEQGRHADALEHLDEGLAIAGGRDSRVRASLLLKRSIALRFLGKTTRALVTAWMALETRERLLGPSHPDTIDAQANVIHRLADNGQVAEAIAMADESLQFASSDGRDLRLQVANLSLARAMALYEAGQYERVLPALADAKRAFANYPDEWAAVELGHASTKAATLWALRRYDEGIVVASGNVDLFTERAGPDDYNTLTARINLGFMQLAVGRYAEAEQSLTQVQQHASATDDQRLRATQGLGQLAFARGDLPEALQRLHTVVATRERSTEVDVGPLGVARQNLAEALLAAGERKRATSQLRRAHEDLQTAGPQWWKEQRGVQTLAKEHGITL
jgi:serine/threonine protein kinase